MTQHEMDSDLEDMRSYLSCTSLVVERCAHESVDQSVLWVFDKDGKQIASISKKETFSQFKWDASKISGGLPITLLPFRNLLEAAAYVVRCC